MVPFLPPPSTFVTCVLLMIANLTGVEVIVHYSLDLYFFDD